MPELIRLEALARRLVEHHENCPVFTEAEMLNGHAEYKQWLRGVFQICEAIKAEGTKALRQETRV